MQFLNSWSAAAWISALERAFQLERSPAFSSSTRSGFRWPEPPAADVVPVRREVVYGLSQLAEVGDQTVAVAFGEIRFVAASTFAGEGAATATGAETSEIAAAVDFTRDSFMSPPTFSIVYIA